MVRAWKIKIHGSDEIVGVLHHEWTAEEQKALYVLAKFTAEGPPNLSGMIRVDFTQIGNDTLMVHPDAPLTQLPSFVPAENPKVA